MCIMGLLACKLIKTEQVINHILPKSGIIDVQATDDTIYIDNLPVICKNALKAVINNNNRYAKYEQINYVLGKDYHPAPMLSCIITEKEIHLTFLVMIDPSDRHSSVGDISARLDKNNKILAWAWGS